MLVTYISFNIFVDIYYNLLNHFGKSKRESDYFVLELKAFFLFYTDKGNYVKWENAAFDYKINIRFFEKIQHFNHQYYKQSEINYYLM